jgi:hypothetical protein
MPTSRSYTIEIGICLLVLFAHIIINILMTLKVELLLPVLKNMLANISINHATKKLK